MKDQTDLINNTTDDEIGYVSNSALKREKQAIQGLCEELSEASGKALTEFGLAPRVIEALIESKRLIPRARKRHLRFVAKLLVNEDIEALRKKLASVHDPHRANTAAFCRAEQLRDRLLSGDNTVLQEILQCHPGADTQRLRQLTRNAIKETAQGKMPKSARELFSLIAETTTNE